MILGQHKDVVCRGVVEVRGERGVGRVVDRLSAIAPQTRRFICDPSPVTYFGEEARRAVYRPGRMAGMLLNCSPR